MLAVLLALALLTPATAAAQASTTNAPPGNAAIDEYLETVPGASGNAAARAPVTTGGSPTAAARDRLEQLGTGRALATVVESTSAARESASAARESTSRASRKHRSSSAAVRLPSVKGHSPVGAVLAVAEGDGGMGLLLPAILLASLLAVIGLVLLRRRSGS